MQEKIRLAEEAAIRAKEEAKRMKAQRSQRGQAQSSNTTNHAPHNGYHQDSHSRHWSAERGHQKYPSDPCSKGHSFSKGHSPIQVERGTGLGMPSALYLP